MAQTLTFDSSPLGSLHLRLRFHTHDLPVHSTDQVLIQFLAAPINPLDVLVLQDKYPVKPQSFHASQPVPGYDGVAVIRSVGSTITHLSPGQRVLVSRHGVGTWRTHACVNATDLLRIPADMDLMAAAVLRMGIIMAYLMLEENTRAAKPGDWIIMNAATSTVAHFLCQFARRKGLKTLAVVRDREDIQSLRRTLTNHCADSVITEEELQEGSDGKKVVLAFDAVFGDQGQKLIKTLTPGGTYVSYGFLGGHATA